MQVQLHPRGLQRPCWGSAFSAPCTVSKRRGARRLLKATSNEDIAVQLAQLKQMISQQQNIINTQQSTIDELRDSLQKVQTPSRVSPSSGWDGSRGWDPNISPFDAQRIGIGDRRMLGMFDTRFHSTAAGATPRDMRVLPEKIFLVRHAESEGNVDNMAYSLIPDPQVPLTTNGQIQAREAGLKIRSMLEQGGNGDYRLFFYTSPYKRSLQTYEHITSAFGQGHIMGVQEEVQLREQDFGNFQDPAGKKREKAERLRFGRFFYRFPDGESGADVYDRLTIFVDHLIRDINAGRFAQRTSLVLVTHGLALRIFLMRWFHWTVDQFLNVYNPGNAEPLVLERVPNEVEGRPGGNLAWVHTKSLYRISQASRGMLRGCTEDMCVTDHTSRISARPSSTMDLTLPSTSSASSSDSGSSMSYDGGDGGPRGPLLGPGAGRERAPGGWQPALRHMHMR